MDLTYPAETEAYRHTVRSFLDQNLPDDWKGYGALPAAERHAWHTAVSYTHLTLPTTPYV